MNIPVVQEVAGSVTLIRSFSGLPQLFHVLPLIIVSFIQLLAWVAQYDARQIGDWEVVGSTPAWSAIFFHGD